MDARIKALAAALISLHVFATLATSCTYEELHQFCQDGSVLVDGLCVPAQFGDMPESDIDDQSSFLDEARIEGYSPTLDERFAGALETPFEPGQLATANWESPEEPDRDGDGIVDSHDNCPDVFNPYQEDWNQNGIGDACTHQDGTLQHPFIISVTYNRADFYDRRDTRDSNSRLIDHYPPHSQNESGPEYFYLFRIDQQLRFEAWLDLPEPTGTDIDLHLLSSVDPLVVVDRNDAALSRTLEAGTYWLVMDTFVSAGTERAGPYGLSVTIEPFHRGTLDDIIPLGDSIEQPLNLPFGYSDARDTSIAESRAIHLYPPFSQNQSGPEYIYGFTIDEHARIVAEIRAPEPDGTDIDVHLLDSLDPVHCIARGHYSIFAEIPPGTYYLALDTFVSNGVPLTGWYQLSVTIRPATVVDEDYFNQTILQAVDYLADNYRLLGYDSAVLTHDIPYGPHGTIERSGGERTMCVAAVMEVILTALEIHAAETSDESIWDFLPIRSWQRLGRNDLKAHIWVNYEIDSGGTADALRHFGMGENIPFEQLRPGGFINLNRTNRTGHAVVFLAFIDIDGNHSDSWHEDVIGFYYFSSQGRYDVGSGGLDFRYAIFEEFGTPPMPYNRDLNVIYSQNQTYLNTGMMFHPDNWVRTSYSGSHLVGLSTKNQPDVSSFDPEYFNGLTADD